MITRQFGERERSFRLLGNGWRDLEKARDCGLGEIAARLAPLVALKAAGLSEIPGGLMQAIAAGNFGSARLDDVRDPLLFGLIDGDNGLTPTECGALVSAVFDAEVKLGRGPMFIWCDLAFAIVSNAIVGMPDEPTLGEQTAAEKAPPNRRSPGAKPASSKSTKRSARPATGRTRSAAGSRTKSSPSTGA